MKKLTMVKSNTAIAFVLAIGLGISGCGSGGNTPAASEPPAATAAAATDQSAAATDQPAAATDQPAATSAPEATPDQTVTTSAPASALDFNDASVPQVNIMIGDSYQTQRAASGYSDLDNPYSRYIFDKTGVRVNVIRQPYTDYDAKVQLTLASNDGSVDYLFVGYASGTLPIAQSGALEPINSYIADPNKYPNFTKVYNADYWKDFSFSSDQLIIAAMNPTANQSSMLIRKDWLDACGLQVPTTVDELYAAAKAFVTQMPDGANPTFAASGRSNMSNLLIGLSAAYGNPSADPQTTYEYLDKTNKKIASWNTGDGARAFYTEIQKWWNDGLIDKESLVNQGSNWWDEIYNGNFGIVSHQSISVGWLTSSIRSTEQKSAPELVIVPPLTGSGYTNEYGNTEIQAADPYDALFGFIRGDKNIDSVLKVLDWECSPEGRDFTFYGLPGIEYDLVNGVKQLTTDRSAAVGFLGDYVFTHGDASLMTPAMWADYVTMQAGNPDSQYDSAADSAARVQAALDYDKAQDRPPFMLWNNMIPQTDAETTYADYETQMTNLWVEMIQGQYDAGTDDGWNAYLKAVADTGYLKVLDEKTQWIMQNDPSLFD